MPSDRDARRTGARGFLLERLRHRLQELRDEVLGLAVGEIELVANDLESLVTALRERVQDWRDDGDKLDRGAEPVDDEREINNTTLHGEPGQ